MNIVEEIKSLDLPKGEYVVFGSGPLAIHKIRDTHDIDLLVSPELYQELKKRGWEEKVWKSGSKYLAYRNVEAGQDWDHGSYNPSLEDLLASAETFDGVPFANLEEVTRWKKVFGRDKDKRDIELINSYLKKQTKQ